jgi:hypothetical protein
VFHRTLDADEAALVEQLAHRATIARLSEMLAERVTEPEQRLVALLARWLDAKILVRV